VDEKYEADQLVEGRVTRVADIGAFVELEPGVEGLLHVSELIGGPSVTPQEVLSAGDELLLKILRVEADRRRIGLSARHVRRDEWERWAARKAAEEAAEAEDTADEEPSAEPEPQPEAVEAAAEMPAGEEAVEAEEAEEAEETGSSSDMPGEDE